jgi:hyperosmotically inducible protein
VIVVLVVVAALAFFSGYRWRTADVPGVAERPGDRPGVEAPDGITTGVDGRPVVEEPAVGTRGSEPVLDADRARERGAEIGGRAAEAVNELGESIGDGALTARIKSKMALDDYVKALDIDVDTNDGIVTLSGTVATAQQRERAVALARETRGVRQVTDRLQVR